GGGLEYAQPYQPIIEALRRVISRPEWNVERATLALLPVWWPELAHLLPELGQSEGHGPPSVPAASATGNDESRLWEGVFQLLSALARRSPLVLLLDDAHWADASSLALLGYVARRAAAVAAPINLS